jgi:hypothetical protein
MNKEKNKLVRVVHVKKSLHIRAKYIASRLDMKLTTLCDDALTKECDRLEALIKTEGDIAAA